MAHECDMITINCRYQSCCVCVPVLNIQQWQLSMTAPCKTCSGALLLTCFLLLFRFFPPPCSNVGLARSQIWALFFARCLFGARSTVRFFGLISTLEPMVFFLRAQPQHWNQWFLHFFRGVYLVLGTVVGWFV